VLNGEKMWITNGGIADIFIVFAKVDGEQFTAFLVERAFPGVSSGKEEHKMGLQGSSTTPIILQDAKVPAGNVLGEVGKGHKVALNTLNYGRFSLGAMCAGGCRGIVTDSVRYAAQRRQFGQPIASFGAIKHKLGEMTARTYALEALLYRTTGHLGDGTECGSSYPNLTIRTIQRLPGHQCRRGTSGDLPFDDAEADHIAVGVVGYQKAGKVDEHIETEPLRWEKTTSRSV
jgi:alkylation response protein AidB-like acyl-CoA dehydrogenase